MFQEELHHEVAEDCLADRIRSNTLKHFFHRAEVWRGFFKDSPGSQLTTFVHELHQWVLGIGDVHCGKHKRGSKKIAVSGDHMSKKGPMCIRAENILHTELNRT